MKYSFGLDEKQSKKAEKWMEEKEAYVGAIGGQFTFRFTPTGLGTIAVICDDESGEELNLTDYDEW
ncbi:hypothetical protein [Aquibacillus saliphilus]|uniref:hypothetical protein n=1 Tax=Aquibacillus saliphilus TaxID=1909422 RepID=UPI001CF0354B|nr:hypothetical protein [Aquibacillus saliphilus]